MEVRPCAICGSKPHFVMSGNQVPLWGLYCITHDRNWADSVKSPEKAISRWNQQQIEMLAAEARANSGRGVTDRT